MSSSLAKSIQDFVRATMAEVDYHATYFAQAVSQNIDGTLDVKCDDGRVGELSAVPVRWGAPGMAAQVGSDAKLLLIFENGDPARPAIVGFAVLGSTELRLGARTGTGADCTQSALLATAFRSAQKQLHNDLSADFAEISAGLTAAASVCAGAGAGPQAALPVLGAVLAGVGAALAPAITGATDASAKLAAFEVAGSLVADWLSNAVKLR